MALPTKALIWTSLNFLRFLSIIACLLVFISNITSMIADGRGVHAAQVDSLDGDDGLTCDYIPGTDVPAHVWGLFWAHLNRIFELFLLIFCIVSELNWGGGSERLFSYTLPILSRSFGTAPLGLLQMILACSNLSHDLGKFPLVTNWILFIIGILNVIAGAVFKAAGKDLRSFHASRRAAVSGSGGAAEGGYGGAKEEVKVGLPFAHQRSSGIPTTPTKSGGLMKQLRYVKDSAPITPQRSNLTPTAAPAGGVAVIGRSSQAFDSKVRYDRKSASTAPLATSEVYLYDSDTDRIRVPKQAAKIGTETQRAGGTSSAPPPVIVHPTSSTPLKAQAPLSGSYNLARAVVARADQLARAKNGSNVKDTQPSPLSANASPNTNMGLAGTETSRQYHVRYGERGEGYGGHWRGHLRQRSSASVTGSISQAQGQSPMKAGLFGGAGAGGSGSGAGHPAAITSHVSGYHHQPGPTGVLGPERAVRLMASPGRPF
ncbi:hypothetical protein A4X09_0g167 [Tilletia walkeri]|uniref:Uncharacterized protein n=1 Tax=Tilletia walkeri TaxID=117179 RepID=A0A8X7T886_9BASI|nr:hypothetical protein A4X09_0g167 [Tilletia walkeri]